jgi:chromosome segregation ATPase
MKKALIAIFLSSLLGHAATPARAEIQQEQTSLTDQLNGLADEYDKLKTERAELAKRVDVLKDAQGMVLAQITRYKTDRTELDMQMSSQQRLIDDHNARCSGTSSDAARVRACNAEAARLNADSGRLDQNNNAMNTRLGLIDTAINTQTEETQKVTAADKAAAERQRQIVVLIKPIMTRLEEIKAEVDGCKKAIADVDAAPDSNIDLKIHLKEIMHDRCGAMFDGNNKP